MRWYHDGKGNAANFLNLSPAFLYRMSLDLEGRKEDVGSPLLAPLRILRSYGCCEEKYFPYPPDDAQAFSYVMNKQISKSMLNNAQKYRIQHYDRIYSILEIKTALSQSNPVMVGVQWFDSNTTNIDGFLKIPEPNQTSRGRHALVIVGHNDLLRNGESGETGFFMIRNSWGTEWGDKGYGYMSYEYFKKYCRDAFVQNIGSFSYKLVHTFLNGKTKLRFYATTLGRVSSFEICSIEIRCGKRTIGWIDYIHNKDKHDTNITELFILPEFRTFELGSMLVDLVKNSSTERGSVYSIIPKSEVDSHFKAMQVKMFWRKNDFRISVNQPYNWAQYVVFTKDQPSNFVISDIYDKKQDNSSSFAHTYCLLRF